MEALIIGIILVALIWITIILIIHSSEETKKDPPSATDSVTFADFSSTQQKIQKENEQTKKDAMARIRAELAEEEKEAREAQLRKIKTHLSIKRLLKEYTKRANTANIPTVLYSDGDSWIVGGVRILYHSSGVIQNVGLTQENYYRMGKEFFFTPTSIPPGVNQLKPAVVGYTSGYEDFTHFRIEDWGIVEQWMPEEDFFGRLNAIRLQEKNFPLPVTAVRVYPPT